ncbi:hypothetical protein PGLA_13870 [Paenibacillus glacialis]|uniref:N-acetyltransferase domain-containing protein n=3 Tax=Paenibacillus TaxID=44249 RepID=A0A162K2P8_9BACL|nr:hypothetical protein PGLA_13870 [Paenibacillus glacialis]
MVDQNYQYKGIGRKALLLALDEIKQTGGLEEIEICYNPNNPVAKDSYASLVSLKSVWIKKIFT